LCFKYLMETIRGNPRLPRGLSTYAHSLHRLLYLTIVTNTQACTLYTDGDTLLYADTLSNLSQFSRQAHYLTIDTRTLSTQAHSFHRPTLFSHLTPLTQTHSQRRYTLYLAPSTLVNTRHTAVSTSHTLSLYRHTIDTDTLFTLSSCMTLLFSLSLHFVVRQNNYIEIRNFWIHTTLENLFSVS